MNTIDDVISKIEELKAKEGLILIAIDGFGGSGKSFLANSLKVKFPEITIVEMDDFYSPELKRADFERVLKQVIIPLKQGLVSNYQIYDWKNDKLVDAKPISSNSLVIVEGVYSLTKELLNNYDIKIWVKCSPEVGLERGVARDGEENRAKWIYDWMPLEKSYEKTQNPSNMADFIINGE